MSELDLRELIAAPIMAVNDAEFANAGKFVELLHEFAFEKSGDDKSPDMKLRNLDFVFDTHGADGQDSKVAVQIPLIQLMPISGVAIDTATMKYSLQLNAAQEKDKDDQTIMRPVFKGRLADPGPDRSSLSGNVEVEVNLKQIDMPMGALNLLQISENAMQQRVQPKPAPLPAPKPKPTLEDIPEVFIELDEVHIEPQELAAKTEYGILINMKRADILAELDHELQLDIGFTPRGLVELQTETRHDVTDRDEFDFTFITLPEVAELSPRRTLFTTLKFSLRIEGKIAKTQTIKLPIGKNQ